LSRVEPDLLQIGTGSSAGIKRKVMAKLVAKFSGSQLNFIA